MKYHKDAVKDEIKEEIIDSAFYGQREIVLYRTMIRVFIDGEPQWTLRHHIRGIADKVGVETKRSNGEYKATREIGKHVIKKLKSMKS